MQVVIPVACVMELARGSQDPFGASVAAWWAGENLLDVAPYIADARVLDLVSLGGFTGREVEGHDSERVWVAPLRPGPWADGPHRRPVGDGGLPGVGCSTGRTNWRRGQR
ncbi:MAG: hypothetical protein VYE68_14155 [Acidobacteriota bacterium]|nr:hypothetical protein [Acidobacteriota bacterium]